MNEDLVIKEIIDLKERVSRIEENMATKDDIRDLKIGQDQMIGLMQRWDEERVHMNHKITELDEDVTKIKLHLKLA